MRIAAVLALGLLGACATTPARAPDRAAALRAEFERPDGRPLVAAHRGCWRGSAENSRRAIEDCIALGVDIIEIDLRVTADGALALSHDANLRRMTGREGRVGDHTLAELRRMRLRAGDGRGSAGGDAALTDQTVLGFDEALRLARGRVLLILDMKDDPAVVAPLAAAVLRREGACGLALFALVAPAEAVEAEVGPLLDCAAYLPNLRPNMGAMGATARSYAALRPRAVAVRFNDWAYLEEGADEVAAMGARVWVNTLDPHHAAGLTDADALRDPDALWGRLLDQGVSIIQTDEPAALRAYLARRARD